MSKQSILTNACRFLKGGERYRNLKSIDYERTNGEEYAVFRYKNSIVADQLNITGLEGQTLSDYVSHFKGGGI